MATITGINYSERLPAAVAAPSPVSTIANANADSATVTSNGEWVAYRKASDFVVVGDQRKSRSASMLDRTVALLASGVAAAVAHQQHRFASGPDEDPAAPAEIKDTGGGIDDEGC